MPNKDGYFQKFVPGYLAYWPHHDEVRAKLWADQQAVRDLARPVRRHYEIVRVKVPAKAPPSAFPELYHSGRTSGTGDDHVADDGHSSLR